jgi:hypothetical protein
MIIAALLLDSWNFLGRLGEQKQAKVYSMNWKPIQPTTTSTTNTRQQ